MPPLKGLCNGGGNPCWTRARVWSTDFANSLLGRQYTRCPGEKIHGIRQFWEIMERLDRFEMFGQYDSREPENSELDPFRGHPV